MSNEDIAKGIAAREVREDGKPEDVAYHVADPAIFIESGGPSIAEQMRRASPGQNWRRGDNKRIPGWGQVRNRLIGQDDKPMLYIMEDCVNLIRTLPLMVHKDNDPEDIDSMGEDHAVDTARYGCMSRPWSPPKTKYEPPKWEQDRTFSDMVHQLGKKRARRERI